MPKSMTGFGRGEGSCGDALVVCEIKTVNSKFLDVNSRLPSGAAAFEPRIKSILAECEVSRGKADVRFELSESTEARETVTCDAKLARAYLDAMNALADEIGDGTVFTLRDVIGKPDVLSVTEAELCEDDLVSACENSLRAACAVLCDMRRREGDALMRDFEARLCKCEELIASVEAASEGAKSAYFSRLSERLRSTLEQYSVEADPQRILTECAIFADKVAVDEETVRLRSHIRAFRELTSEDGPCGRKLDFLVQEMNREANTIGSKCSDAGIAHMVVDLKNEIEKIREQVQNVE